MRVIHNYFLNQGETIKSIIEGFFEHDINDVLEYAYKSEDIEEYLENKKEDIRTRIFDLLKNIKKYEFAETGEDAEINKDFLYYTFLFDGDLRKFKVHLKKASVKALRLYEEILFEQDLLIEKNRNE